MPNSPDLTGMPWLRPAPYDASATSLAQHAAAIGEVMAGRGRLWLGPFAPPSRLAPPFGHTAVVVPTSGSTGTAKAVALAREALIASHDATAQLIGHGFWLPLLPATHIAGVQVIARAHRTAQVHGLPSPALPDPLPDLRGHFDSSAFLALAEPALAQAQELDLPAFTSLVPTQLSRIVTGATGADARARAVLRRFTAVLVGGAAAPREVLARARGQRIAVRTTYGSSETAGGCVYDGRPLPGVQLHIDTPDAEGAGRLRICSPTLALGYLHPDGEGEPLGDTLATSDLASLDADGALSVLGRADDVIVTGGRKVQPQDVERAIDRSLMLRGLIRACVVVGMPDVEWGQQVQALVVLEDGVDPLEAPSLVRSALRTTEVPAYMIPKQVHVVQELPMLGIGKIDRSAARRIAAGVGDPSAS